MNTLNPEAQAHWDLANELIEAGKLKQAAGELILAIKAAKGKFPDAHYILGLVYEDLEDYDNAIKSYEAAIREDPYHTGSLESIAILQANIALWAMQNERNMIWVQFQSACEKSVARIIKTYQSIFRSKPDQGDEWVAWTQWMFDIANKLEPFDSALAKKSAHLHQAIANIPLDKYHTYPEFEELLREWQAEAQRYVILAQERGILPKKRFGLF